MSVILVQEVVSTVSKIVEHASRATLLCKKVIRTYKRRKYS